MTEKTTSQEKIKVWSYWQAIQESELSTTEKMILTVLFTHANKKNGPNHSYPSVATIMRCASVSRATVFNKLSVLVYTGWLHRQNRFTPKGQTSNVYFMRLPPQYVMGNAWEEVELVISEDEKQSPAVRQDGVQHLDSPPENAAPPVQQLDPPRLTVRPELKHLTKTDNKPPYSPPMPESSEEEEDSFFVFFDLFKGCYPKKGIALNQNLKFQIDTARGEVGDEALLRAVRGYAADREGVDERYIQNPVNFLSKGTFRAFLEEKPKTTTTTKSNYSAQEPAELVTQNAQDWHMAAKQAGAITITPDNVSGLEDALKCCIEKGGFVVGGVGTGKTTAATNVLRELTGEKEPEKKLYIVNWGWLYRQYREASDDKSTDPNSFKMKPSDVIRHFVEKEFVVIDEIALSGRVLTDAERGVLYDIIDGRYAAEKKTVLMSNYGADVVKKSVGHQVFDRIIGGGCVVNTPWDSLRK